SGLRARPRHRPSHRGRELQGPPVPGPHAQWRPGGGVPPEVTTAQTSTGTLRGTSDGGVEVFRGVPYAQPPVGELRWRPPEPVEPWAGTRDATTFGPIPPQA